MAFNAHWELEEVASHRGLSLHALITGFRQDFASMVQACDVYRLAVADSGNTFRLFDPSGREFLPPSEAGLYSIFCADRFLYCGEATDLFRRQLKDPDNTADSTKRFSNQGRAILKLVLHRGWAAPFGLDPLLIQLYPGGFLLGNGATFEGRYLVSRFSKALEGAASLFVHGFHSAMVARARSLGLIRPAG
jgi:hypothetical protein